MSKQGVRVFKDESEVTKYWEEDKENNQVVIFKGVVYDIKEFMPEHPGGSHYIEDNLGKDIDQEFEDAEHTKFAEKMFNDFEIRGKMASKVAEESAEANQSSKPLVTITGISGYLGAQVCLTFLKDGSYKVRGTVRSTKNPKKIDPLKKAFGAHFSKLELVEADLLNEQSLIKAIEGSKFVVHTASPFPLTTPKDENELIKPAVNGTLAVMRGCQKAKVERLVITSSIAAIGRKDKDHFTVADWSDADNDKAYAKSKHLAEKAAWDFLKKLPEDQKFELATINPGLIIGPNLNSAQFSSGDIVQNIMMGSFPGNPDIALAMVDVRDCAEAHLKALKVPKAAGNRFILVEGTYGWGELAEALHSEYSKFGYPIPTRALPYFLIQIGSFFSDAAKEAKLLWGRKRTFDNKETKEVLGIKFTPMKKSAVDMAKTLIQTGYIPNYEKDGKPANVMLKATIFFGILICTIFLFNGLLKAQDEAKISDL